jgi:hypothetical protein
MKDNVTKVKYRVFLPSALRIYEKGLSCLMNRDWFFETFPEYLNFRIAYGKVPNGLFKKTLHIGILHVLGSIFFDQILAITEDALFCDAKTAFSRSAEVYYLLIGFGCIYSNVLLNLALAIDEVDELLVETPEKRVNSSYHRHQADIRLQAALEAVNDYHENDINELRDIYARNFSERVLHDRQMCEYISFALADIYENKGVPIRGTNRQIVVEPVKRQKWPSWILPTLQSRDRGKCANCGTNFRELESEPNIDHIVPLSRGGNNDIVNLQLLCAKCNLDKLNKPQLVKSSVPSYLNWHKRMQQK